MSRYVCLNGENIPADLPVIKANNRAFNFGDGAFETIRCLNSEPLFFANHYMRLRNALYNLKIELPAGHTENYFRKQIFNLLQQNRMYQGASVKIVVFRKGGGKYIPETNESEYIIYCIPTDTQYFTLNDKGIRISLFHNVVKPINIFSAYKNCNSLIYVMAGIYKKEQNIDDCLLYNQEGKIIEAISSNFFLVENNKLITPSVESGCVDGTMRRTVIEIARKLSIPVIETMGITKDDLFAADEIFLTNAVVGVRWVLAFEDKRYFHTISNQLILELNKLITT